MGEEGGHKAELSALAEALARALMVLSTAELTVSENTNLLNVVDDGIRKLKVLQLVHGGISNGSTPQNTAPDMVNESLKNGAASTAKAAEKSAESDVGAERNNAEDGSGPLASVLREVVLLETLAFSDRLYTKDELLAAIRKHGFIDISEAAIVTQLHRLTVQNVIERPYRGAYLINDAGRKRLSQQRTRLGDKAPKL